MGGQVTKGSTVNAIDDDAMGRIYRLNAQCHAVACCFSVADAARLTRVPMGLTSTLCLRKLKFKWTGRPRLVP